MFDSLSTGKRNVDETSSGVAETNKILDPEMAFLLALTRRIAVGGPNATLLADCLTLFSTAVQADGIRALIGAALDTPYELGTLGSVAANYDAVISDLVRSQAPSYVTLAVPNLQVLPPELAALAPLAEHFKAISILPLVAYGNLQGIITLCYHTQLPPVLSASPLAEIVCSQFATLIANATARQNQSDVVGTLAHDLRSPLTYMQGYASMIPAMSELTERQAAYLDKITVGITQMSELVEKVLDVRKIEPDGNYRLNRSATDVINVLHEIVNTHSDPAVKKGLTLTLEVDPSLPIMSLDELMLRRAINNLADNAVKYTPAPGAITIRGYVANNQIVIAVKDTGLGISAENQKHLFSQFRRIQRRDTIGVKGSGLGLYIVKGVAQRHGGDAKVESVEGEGSTFFIMLPLDGPNLHLNSNA